MMLGSDQQKLTMPNGLERIEQLRNQGAQHPDPIVRGDQDDDCDRQGCQVLLKLQVLVARKQDVKFPCRLAEELSVPESRL